MPSNFFETDAAEADVLQYKWNAVLFRKSFEEGDSLRRKRMRLAALQGTLAFCSRKTFNVGPPAEFVEESSPISGPVAKSSKDEPARISVLAVDTLDCALWLHEKDPAGARPESRIHVLVMASRAQLGGGYRNGAGAQEEHIYRGTSISLLHSPDAQLSTELSMAVCEKVSVVRGSERSGYPFVASGCTIRTMSIAGIAHPQIEVLYWFLCCV